MNQRHEQLINKRRIEYWQWKYILGDDREESSDQTSSETPK